MNKISHNLYSNFLPEEILYENQKQVNEVSVILLGKCGSGKSRLTNRICLSEFEVGISIKGLTKDLQSSKYKLNSNCILEVDDTPGIDNTQENSKEKIQNYFKDRKYNLILPILKIDCRFQDRTVADLKKYRTLLKDGHVGRIVYLVSHLDALDEMQQAQKEYYLKDFLSLLDNQERVIFFSNKNSDPLQLAKILYAQGRKMEKQYLKVSIQQLCKIEKRIFMLDDQSQDQESQQNMQQPKIKQENNERIDQTKIQQNNQPITEPKIQIEEDRSNLFYLLCWFKFKAFNAGNLVKRLMFCFLRNFINLTNLSQRKGLQEKEFIMSI